MSDFFSVNSIAQSYMNEYDKNKDGKIRLEPKDGRGLLDILTNEDGSETSRDEKFYLVDENNPDYTTYYADSLFNKADEMGNKDGFAEENEVIHVIKMFDENEDDNLTKNGFLEKSINFLSKKDELPNDEYANFDKKYGESILPRKKEPSTKESGEKSPNEYDFLKLYVNEKNDSPVNETAPKPIDPNQKTISIKDVNDYLKKNKK